MGLESATYIPELSITNPVGASDPKSQGDDHLRLIKKTLSNTFGAFVGTAGSPKSVTLTEDQINDAVRKAVNNVLTGRLETDDSTTTRAGFNIPTGVAPTSPDHGDIWVTASDILARIDGVTESLLGGKILKAVKTADETVSNSDVLQDDDHLSVTVVSGKYYHIKVYLRVTSNTAMDFRWAFSAPGSTLEGSWVAKRYQHASAAHVVFAGAALETGQTELIIPSAVECMVIIEGVYKAAASGTFVLQWAQGTAVVSDTKVLEASSMTLTLTG